MGYPAIYSVIEQGKTEHFYSHYGGNALSPMLRLQQAMEIQEQLNLPITHILEHLSNDGTYKDAILDPSTMFCDPTSYDPKEPRKGSGIEMYITLDLDQQSYTLDFNEEYSCYISMGKYEIPIEYGLETLHKTLEFAEKNGIEDFYSLLSLYNNSTGISEAMDQSRGNFEVQEMLDSPEAEEQRERLRQLTEEKEELQEHPEQMEDDLTENEER